MAVVMKVQILMRGQFWEFVMLLLNVMFNSTSLQFGMGMSGDSHYVCVINVCLNTMRVRIATDYGLDGPGSNPGGDEIFHQSRPTLGPTQPPVKWVPVLSRGKVRPGRAADYSPPSSAAVMEE